MKLSLLLILVLLICKLTIGQTSKINITIHSRVDTTKKEVKEIVDLWTNYLNSKPDSIYDNPYWNEEEKKKYKNFDFSIRYMYQFPSQQLLNYYKPTILSVEKEGDNYVIRTLFEAEGPEGYYKTSNPWCITKLYAIKENNLWKLKNALSVQTKNWERKNYGKITYIYPSQHKFNEKLAIKSSKFCDSIKTLFHFPEWKPFEFYITESGDALGQLLNFDFFFAGYTTGTGMNDIRKLFSGRGSEWYPHEFVHLIVPNYERHRMIEEGFATWLGGAGEKTFDECAKILAIRLIKNDTVTFQEILDQKWGWQYNAYYTTGAIFCKLAYDKYGINGVKKLLEIPKNNDKLTQTICNLFNIDKSDLDKFLRTETLQFIKK